MVIDLANLGSRTSLPRSGKSGETRRGIPFGASPQKMKVSR